MSAGAENAVALMTTYVVRLIGSLQLTVVELWRRLPRDKNVRRVLGQCVVSWGNAHRVWGNVSCMRQCVVYEAMYGV